MKEHPILFSAPMVRAILAGTKTQTRRISKVHESGGRRYVDLDGTARQDARCPYGQAGDKLWVRETWAVAHPLDHLKPSEIPQGPDLVYYVATENTGGLLKRPSLFMPRWASRITLEVTEVRVERLQAISRGDAMDEGCPFPNMAQGPDPRQWYAELWERINGGASWEANPWVWCIAFKRVTP